MRRLVSLSASVVVALAAWVTLSATGQTQSDPQRPVFRGGVARVRIDTLVTHDNKPVRGLVAADFELRDNGVLQQIDLATTAGSVAVAIALDVSGSVEEEGLEDLLKASAALADALRPGDVAWLVTFHDQFDLRAGPVTDAASLKGSLQRIQPGGGTSMWDALFGSVGLVAGTAGRSLVLLFSDGMDSTSWLDEERAIEALSRGDVVVEGIRPRGTVGGLAPLTAVARATGGAVREAESSEKMGTQFVNLLEQFRLGYVLTYLPTGAATPGWHDVEVRLKSKKGKIRARRGYYIN
jgi:Ca-activated chloride channel homolog